MKRNYAAKKCDICHFMEFLNQYSYQSNELFSSLTINELDLVNTQLKKIKYRKGQLIFHEEGIPTGVFLLIEGKIKIFKTGLNGKEQIFYIYKNGDVLGYHPILCNEIYTESCETLEYCTVGFIEKQAFLKLLSAIPHLKELLVKNMSHEFGVMVNTIMVMAQKPLRERLALFLLLLDEKYKKDNDSIILLSRVDLANIVGASRESLTRQLRDYKDEKLIKTVGRGIIVINHNELYKLAKS